MDTASSQYDFNNAVTNANQSKINKNVKMYIGSRFFTNENIRKLAKIVIDFKNVKEINAFVESSKSLADIAIVITFHIASDNPHKMATII